MSELVQLHESLVTEDQIDTLGHMNVRYYVERMTVANEVLLQKFGVRLSPGQIVRRTDTYTKFLREQFSGATLQTFGGVVDAPEEMEREGISAYFEIRNAETQDLAACFIVTSNVIVDATQERVTHEVPGNARHGGIEVEIPAHGSPRTLSLQPPGKVAFDELSGYIADHEIPGAMYGRREGLVQDVDCDANGRLREEVDLMFVMYRPEHEEAPDTQGPPLFRDEHGRRYSFAIMENRAVVWQRPMNGDALVSLSGDLAWGEKWRQTRRWIFNRTTKELLGVSDHVALCMDLDARKAIPIPAEELRLIEENCLTQFA
jgi:acyl-CoA thioester hydrolase